MAPPAPTFEAHKSKLFARIQNNYREILVGKTIRLEGIHTEKSAMWHYAPLRTRARGHSLWFTAWLAMRKTWINYSLWYCDGFLPSIYYLFIFIYHPSIHTHIFIYTSYIQIYDSYKYMSNIYAIPIQILEGKWNNRSRRRRFPFQFWLCLL